VQPRKPMAPRNPRCRFPLCLGVGALFLLAQLAVAQTTSSPFPVPDVLRPNIAFWKQIFTRWGSHDGILHDTTDVRIIYRVLSKLPENPKRRRHLIDRHRRYYTNILLRLAHGKRRRLTADERRVLALFKGKQTPRVLRAAAHDIRFQLGLRDRFAAGLVRSGAYLPTINRIFAAAGLPQELGLLPHVESSFNNHAHSKSRAAGMWQFTRGTGKRFLRIDRAIDERLDFELATIAATRLLQENYQELGTWPLAITAYNHGVGGMKRAVAQLRTRDFGTIVKRYRNRSFGFASKNFYAEFLAAIDITQHHQHHFPGLLFDMPLTYHNLTLDAPIAFQALARHLGVPARELAEWNLAIRPPVHRGYRSLPKGYTLHLPHDRLTPAQARARWASIPARTKTALRSRAGRYRIRPGDTLSDIAQRHRTTVAKLMDLNDIDRANTIKAGQLLRLPAKTTRRRNKVGKKRAPAKPRPHQITVASVSPTRFTANPSSTAPSISDPRLAFRLLMAGLPLSQLLASEAVDWIRVKDGVIQVVATESLGLYAEWLELPVERLHALNRLPRNRPLRLGAEIRLDFSKISEMVFTKRRILYHQRIEENFFRAYTVGRVITHTLKHGETLWQLARHEYDIPLWLIQRYNYDLNFRSLIPGTKLRIPQVIEKAKTS
jgi:membrane-bound lytic murein transglycosylase D